MNNAFVRAAMRHRPAPAGLFVLLALPATLLSGTNFTQAQILQRGSDVVVFCIDGAGTGALFDVTPRVHKGLAQAGFRGDFHVHEWQTGLGPGADQIASKSFKRRQASALAAVIRDYIDRHPGRPVNLIALSAGAAVSVFALEMLPTGYQVDNVVLLSASISSDYDLTPALRHVRGRLYAFSSRTDLVLGLLVPLVGTADRTFGPTVGTHGARLPRGASAETCKLYAKVENIPWRSEFARSRNFGDHYGTTRKRFIQGHVAPLVMKVGPELQASSYCR